MVAFLKAGPQVRTYSDNLRAARRQRKKILWSCPEALEPRLPTMLQNCKLPVSSPCRNTSKTPAVHLTHLEKEDARRDEDEESDDPVGIEGVTKEFMVCLVRAVKDSQAEKKCCYHCGSPEHFIHNCLLVKTLRENAQFNSKEGRASKKGAQTPLAIINTSKNLQMEVPKV